MDGLEGLYKKSGFRFYLRTITLPTDNLLSPYLHLQTPIFDVSAAFKPYNLRTEFFEILYFANYDDI